MFAKLQKNLSSKSFVLFFSTHEPQRLGLCLLSMQPGCGKNHDRVCHSPLSSQWLSGFSRRKRCPGQIAIPPDPVRPSCSSGSDCQKQLLCLVSPHDLSHTLALTSQVAARLTSHYLTTHKDQEINILYSRGDVLIIPLALHVEHDPLMLKRMVN